MVSRRIGVPLRSAQLSRRPGPSLRRGSSAGLRQEGNAAADAEKPPLIANVGPVPICSLIVEALDPNAGTEDELRAIAKNARGATVMHLSSDGLVVAFLRSRLEEAWDEVQTALEAVVDEQWEQRYRVYDGRHSA